MKNIKNEKNFLLFMNQKIPFTKIIKKQQILNLSLKKHMIYYLHEKMSFTGTKI